MPSFTQVQVKGLDHSATKMDIRYFFRNCGEIRKISMISGYCFVEFEDYKDAAKIFFLPSLSYREADTDNPICSTPFLHLLELPLPPIASLSQASG